MVGGWCVFITAAISDGEAPSVVCVELGDWFFPNVHFVLADGGKVIRLEGCWIVGRRLGIRFGGAVSLLILCKMTLYGFSMEGQYLESFV